MATGINLQAHQILTDGVPFFLQGDHGMKYAYASKTGHVEKIVQKLGLADAIKITDGTETVEDDYILFTYTTGKGKTPKQVEEFLSHNKNIQAVVGSGSRSKSHVDTFNFAADNIGKQYNVPVLARLDGTGTDEEIDLLKDAIETL